MTTDLIHRICIAAPAERIYCNTTWGHLLVILKEYAERGVKNPYFA